MIRWHERANVISEKARETEREKMSRGGRERRERRAHVARARRRASISVLTLSSWQ